jgi:type I restriction enzyme M protein
MYGRLIFQITEILRGAVSTEELFPFAMQLIAWVRLSRLGKLKGELAFNENNLPRGVGQIEDIFNQLRKSELLGQDAMAFNYVNQAVHHFSASQILAVLEMLVTENLKDAWQKDEFIAFIHERTGRSFLGLPVEVAELMVALAQIKQGDKVYLPFELAFQLTACAQKVSDQTFSETRFAGALPWLMNLLCDIEANIAIVDSLEKPAYLDEGRLTQFPVSIAMPPFNVRYNPSVAESDRFARFPENTTSGGVLTVRHMLARTKGRMVIAVTNGLLFTPGVERALRDDLLAKKQIEAIVALPPALLSGATIQFSLMVMRTDVQCNDILFVDGSNEVLYKKDGRNKATLTGWQTIVDAVIKRETNDFSSLVPVEDVIANNAQLQVSRYCKTSDDEVVEQLLNKYENKTLGDLVSIVRPIPLSQTEGSVTVSEVAPADFPEFGYASRPGREIKLTQANIDRNQKSFLRPFDILITIKGNAGKVAILSEDTPENEWVMGQSCIVLRTDAKSYPLDPRVLFSFLKSEVGQLQLKGIGTGAAVSVIQVRELEKLRMPVPTVEDAKGIVNKFEKLSDIEKTIIQHREEQEQLSKSIWSA